MPCLCQYFTTELGLRVKASLLDVKDNDGNGNENIEKGQVITGEVSASELANCKAEIHKLQKDLSSYRILEENMEFLMKKMIGEQQFLVAEITDLRKINEDMRLQQTADRNNQALERSALLRELNEIKSHLYERSNVVQNESLTNALKDANEKIYAMGMKYLKLRSNRGASKRTTIKNDHREDEEKSYDSSVSDESLGCDQ
ncbi:uncharacterized protein LOC129916498 isoform X2 [Episyrphus balteatus]|uniref:uncharacterized protein LOC129916498 isoform X2 n=1 Tax=Episyrphus balteatus TaxID=286459 RepID=UPI0024853F57|nr:uncharacterized protein LOC129916498 isoform X2 [Episyrphus balteatus]